MSDIKVLIDGNSLGFRNLYSKDQLFVTTKSGKVYTGTVFGFIKELLQINSTIKPNEILVFWDGGKDRKKAIYPEYKANRKLQLPGDMTKEDLWKSFKVCRIMLKHMGLKQYRVKGEEADDLLASACALFPESEKIVVSSDHDMFQLVGYKVKLLKLTFKGREVWNEIKFKDKFGFSTKYYPQYLSIVGDQTDHIPGIKGIGEKTADQIFAQFNKPTLRNIYKHINQLDCKDRIKKLLAEGKDDAIKFYQIIKLRKDIELQLMYNPKRDEEKLMKMMKALKLKTFYANDVTLQAIMDIPC